MVCNACLYRVFCIGGACIALGSGLIYERLAYHGADGKSICSRCFFSDVGSCMNVMDHSIVLCFPKREVNLGLGWSA